MGRIKICNTHQARVDVKEFFVMKQLSLSILACAAVAFVPAACAADEEVTPPKETQEATSETSSFNFAIPGDDTTPASSGFNFKNADDASEGQTALGNIDLPTDDGASIETFDTELTLPKAEDEATE